MSKEIDDFFNDGEEVSILDTSNIKEPRVIPSYKESELKEFREKLDVDVVKQAEKDIILMTHLNRNNNDTCMVDDIGSKDNYNLVDNEIEHNGVMLTSRRKLLDKRAKSPKTGILKLKQKVGLGAPASIPLYHSGFWVKIDTLTKEEIVNLEFDIIDKLNEVGKLTNTLAFSHKEVLFAEVILETFTSKILTTSLKLEEDDNILDYIHINDIPIIAWYLATTMYPNGFNALIPCKESLSYDDKGIPKCSNMLKLKVDMEELLHVDKSKLSVKHLDIMSKKQSNSVTIDEVVTYQESLPTSGVKEFRYDIDGDESIINVMSPTASKYLQYGQHFIDTMEVKTNTLVKDKEKLDRETAMLTILKLIELTTYNHYVDSIPVDDTTLTDISDINEALTVLGDVDNLKSKIFKDIKEYIDDSIIASIGIPSFTCSVCHTEQTTKEYIPISVYNYFFILLHSKYQKIASQIQKQVQKENI